MRADESTYVEPWSPTAWRVSNHDIMKPIPFQSVNQRIEESQRALPSRKARIVQ
jgi:hypothetical protein